MLFRSENIKISSGYSAIPRRYLDSKKQRFSGMKSHDCHLMMMQLLPVALRGIMDKHVCDTLLDLCNVFDVVSRKSISLKRLDRLKEEIVVILCDLEIYFPPAFFDVMLHLLVHIVDEIVDLGPLFLHNMMAFERMNGIVKGYVCNRARPDGSIVHGFLAEECILFCENFMEVKKSIGVPLHKHVGRLDGVGHKPLKVDLHVDYAKPNRRSDLDRAHLVVLQHLKLVDPWLEKHKRTIRKKYADRGEHKSDESIIREHNKDFTSWFKERLKKNPLKSSHLNA